MKTNVTTIDIFLAQVEGNILQPALTNLVFQKERTGSSCKAEMG
jgi:hypothetical protein